MKQKPDAQKSSWTAREKSTFRLVLIRRLFGYLSTGLVVSAILGGLYRDRLHFIWGLCAAGAICIAMGWWEYLRITDSLPFRKRKKDSKNHVPYILRKDKEKKRHKPAFLQNAEDFDDDLTPYTTADMEILGEKRRAYAFIAARISAGLLLFILSFVIHQ
ncbi:MAG: hypothetical protein IJ325_00970 [Clostridia bacterium]|nr:hypothetical protein [Clostridia bacterium]